MKKFKELFESKGVFSEEVSDEDVQYFYQLADQAKKDKKTKSEVTDILKSAGAPRDIIADLIQRWKK